MAVLLVGCSTDADDWDKKKQPEVHAGDDQVISTPITAVALQGKVTHHLDMYDTKSVQWRQSSGPSQVTLLDADELSARFIYPDQVGEYVFELTVIDTGNRKGTDSVKIIINTAGTSAKAMAGLQSAPFSVPGQAGAPAVFEMLLNFQHPLAQVNDSLSPAHPALTITYDINHNAVFDEGDIRFRVLQPVTAEPSNPNWLTDSSLIVESMLHGTLYQLQDQALSDQGHATQPKGSVVLNVKRLGWLGQAQGGTGEKALDSVLAIQVNKTPEYSPLGAEQAGALLARVNDIKSDTPVQVAMVLSANSADYIPGEGVYSQHAQAVVPDPQDDYTGLNSSVDLTSLTYRHR
ncbi:PKD domain-containing protein [Photobacterium sp. TY1-4]|uniref:PKD domain-containing protein n=1 Tax=Photobacterium sp. TY1-4 TaxID=2899122 RepID=UPI0021C1D21F|nr:hypothetical protein [Photobacterium sp. TY1-4]UXH99895.1 hypothetical protein NH461_08585 [Photobacterium sp. TY1-4]